MRRGFTPPRVWIATSALCLALAAGPVLAGPAAGAKEPSATVPELTSWVGDDGKPDASAWKHAAHFSVDNEIQPGRNSPAPVTTEVAVGYTKTALWLRFTAHDPNPRNITVKYRLHDGFDNNDEYVGMIFSPFNDTQWGYEFFCSTGATEFDEFRQSGNEYSSYDAIWYCKAELTKQGYVVTMEIPFRSLKFPHSDQPQTWRMLFFRNWARKVRHQITQVKVNYNSNCTLCDAEVVRTATPIRAQGANLQIIPQATIARTDTRTSPSSGLVAGSPQISGGLDARWAIR
ncbi:MAG TPA: hypothetical protein VFX38_01495, partial [Gammaproteobacteria bacterium]|nr:hypothetical protein [Gammaproteobacteria bacterium]